MNGENFLSDLIEERVTRGSGYNYLRYKRLESRETAEREREREREREKKYESKWICSKQGRSYGNWNGTPVQLIEHLLFYDFSHTGDITVWRREGEKKQEKEETKHKEKRCCIMSNRVTSKRDERRETRDRMELHNEKKKADVDEKLARGTRACSWEQKTFALYGGTFFAYLQKERERERERGWREGRQRNTGHSDLGWREKEMLAGKLIDSRMRRISHPGRRWKQLIECSGCKCEVLRQRVKRDRSWQVT